VCVGGCSLPFYSACCTRAFIARAFIGATVSSPSAVSSASLFESVTIDEPRWWAIWIGPQQQHEPNQALGEKCELWWPLGGSKCPTQGCVTFSNITLRNVHIEKPWLSPGAIMGNGTAPMQGVVFDNVHVNSPGYFPFKSTYECKDAGDAVATGKTSPVPACFKDHTSKK
jgi:hypothetical protein